MNSNSQEKETLNNADPTSHNQFDKMEWAGAFGDLGTFIPFAAGYISILKMDPNGLLFAFGMAMIFCGVYYKTPIPVQPMKAIGAVAITQAAQTHVITPETVIAASLATGILWLLIGLTGAANRIEKLVPRSVVAGIVLGLGLNFMIKGIHMMIQHWIVAGFSLLATFLLLNNRRIPVMFLLLLSGGIYGAILHPELVHGLTSHPLAVRFPGFALLDLGWDDIFIGTVFLAIPQLPLTLGNAVIAIRDENNRLFPEQPVTYGIITTSTGLMNICGSLIGGVPMCHGAGGMAGHAAFGARTGGAIIILGTLLLMLSLFFSDSVAMLFQLIPSIILGIIIFIAGAQLASGAFISHKNNKKYLITFITAALTMWNIGVAFIFGISCEYFVKNKLNRL